MDFYNIMSSRSKRPGLLKPTEISELVFDTDSDVECVSSDTSSDSVLWLSQPQPCHQTASSREPSSSVSSSASDEEDAVESGPGEQIEQAVTLQWTRPSCPQSSVAHTFTGAPRGKKDNEASQINDGSSPLSLFLLYLQELSVCSWWRLTATTMTT